MVNYRKLWENHHKKQIPVGYEIHHIDGNKNNNHIDNLECLSIEEHLHQHEKQNDWGACHAISIRLNFPNDGIFASKFQNMLFEKGIHNFQKMTKKRRSEISRLTIKKRIETNGGAFIISDTIKNASNAGKIAAQKKAGFLNINSKNHGSNHVKNTYWWTNEINEHKRSKEKPIGNWKKGMKYED